MRAAAGPRRDTWDRNEDKYPGYSNQDKRESV